MCVFVCVTPECVSVFDGDGNRSRFFRGPLELRGVVCVCLDTCLSCLPPMVFSVYCVLPLFKSKG